METKGKINLGKYDEGRDKLNAETPGIRWVVIGGAPISLGL